MALKDWKKDHRFPLAWRSPKKIIVINSPNKRINEKDFNVYVNTLMGLKLVNRHFKTKTQALKFAKKYMRRH